MNPELDRLFEKSTLRKHVANYLKHRETADSLREKLLSVIALFTQETPNDLLTIPSKEDAEKSTNDKLKKFKEAFVDQSTNVLHKNTISAIDQSTAEFEELIEGVFSKINKLLITPNPNVITPTELQAILEDPLALITDKEAGSFNTEIVVHCEKYLQLLLTTLQSIQEVQQLNLVAQYMRDSKISAQAHIKELFTLYKEYLEGLDEEFDRINDPTQNLSIDKESLGEEIDTFENKIKKELLIKRIHKNEFAMKKLNEKTTPGNAALTILFFELVREKINKFGKTLLQEINDLRKEQGLMKTMTFDDANLPMTFNDGDPLYSPPFSPGRNY